MGYRFRRVDECGADLRRPATGFYAGQIRPDTYAFAVENVTVGAGAKSINESPAFRVTSELFRRDGT
jgi:hypothetical protein